MLLKFARFFPLYEKFSVLYSTVPEKWQNCVSNEVLILRGVLTQQDTRNFSKGNLKTQKFFSTASLLSFSCEHSKTATFRRITRTFTRRIISQEPHCHVIFQDTALTIRKYVNAVYVPWYSTRATIDKKNSKNILSMSPHEFVEFLKLNKVNRCFLIWSDSEQRVVASHPVLNEIEQWLNDPGNPQYRRHEAIFLNLGSRSDCLLGAFLCKINRGQACGGIRMTPFATLESYLCEGLRLSRIIGAKSALAGLWVGGGKGLIPEPKDRQHFQPEFRQKLCYDYGDFLSSLNGCYIAGMDTGISTYDMYNVHSRTRWAICGPEDIGGSGNAATHLGRGVLCAMEAALNFLHLGDLSGKKVAVQGAGGIGLEVVSGLLDRGVSQVYVTDTSQKRVGDLHDMLISKSKGRLTVRKVPIGDMSILSYNCDILAPCAIGHVLTHDTILGVKAKVICGAANGLLSSDEFCNLLTDMGITYVLEYLPNRMALVNSVYENYGRLYKDSIIERHFDKKWEHSIYVLTQKVLQLSSSKSLTVIEAGNQLADEFSEEHHPIWPGRTKAIIQDLIAGQWHHGHDFWRKRRNFAKSESCA